ncbi:MAG: hypothetical protein IKU58_08115 [Clostridia bacterium]|nr:hypothetical protein [Clostridia bacterium]
MFFNCNKQFKCASAASAAASFACAILSNILDAALLASILFALIVLDLPALGVLVVLITILRITGKKTLQPASLA